MTCRERESGPAGVDGGCPLCGAVTGLVERGRSKEATPRPSEVRVRGREGSGPAFSAPHIPLESSGSPWGRRVELTQFNMLLT